MCCIEIEEDGTEKKGQGWAIIHDSVIIIEKIIII